jgi:hypothetical protein
MHTKFWSENLKRPLEDLSIDVRVILEWKLGKQCGTGFIWLWIGTSGGLL